MPNPTAPALRDHCESHPFELLVARPETVVVIPQRSIFSFDRTRETFSNHPKLSWAALAAIIVIPFVLGFALNYLRQGPSGTILVESDPVGASVACDGRDMGRRTPARFDVKIGPHSLSLRMPGYDSHDVPRFDIDESPGVKRLGPYTLNPIVVMAQIDSNPQKATVFVDGKATDVITPGRVSLPLGRHFVELVRPGYQTKILPAVECRQGEQIIDLGIFPLVAKDRVVRIASAPPGAAVRLDGVLRRPTPTEVELPVGSHRIRLSLSGYDALESNFDVEAGDSVQHVEDFRVRAQRLFRGADFRPCRAGLDPPRGRDRTSAGPPDALQLSACAWYLVEPDGNAQGVPAGDRTHRPLSGRRPIGPPLRPEHSLPTHSSR